LPQGASELRVDEAGQGLRLDVWLRARFPGWSRRRIARALQEGRVRVDGRRARKGQLLHAGSRVELSGPPDTAENLRPAAEDTGIEVLHEDEALVALHKPAGMPSHPLRAGEHGTLANALVARFPECALASDDPREAGLCHRLDAGTSGVLLAARTREAYRAVREAFRRGQVDKEYLALVAGEARAEAIRGPVGDRALPAETRIEPLERLAGFTLVRCATRGGQRHQVRVHLAESGHPVAGDSRYGGPPLQGLSGFFLHAAAVRLPHPATGAILEVRAPLPGQRQRLLATLRGR
jgi:23S rRNA pseudouridine1911/1915/1917 synthase